MAQQKRCKLLSDINNTWWKLLSKNIRDIIIEYIIIPLQVGSPEKTAWTINDKGNRVWFSYEHTPTLFPVTETRFYKPKLHKMDFLGKRKKEEDGRNI